MEEGARAKVFLWTWRKFGHKHYVSCSILHSLQPLDHLFNPCPNHPESWPPENRLGKQAEETFPGDDLRFGQWRRSLLKFNENQNFQKLLWSTWGFLGHIKTNGDTGYIKKNWRSHVWCFCWKDVYWSEFLVGEITTILGFQNLFETVLPHETTLGQSNIAMENGPFEDTFPIQNGDFPLLC